MASIRIALSKGRIFDETAPLLARAGIRPKQDPEHSRKLILATNRRGDLDEAFLRRLRYIVDFPIPDAAERRRIWTSVLPPSVDPSDLDLDFLARQFQLTGGNIRSAVLNACLQTAADASTDRTRSRPLLRMEHVLVAIKREHEKFQRALGPTQFGTYARLVEGLHGG